jgi:hypothetical protein
VNVQGDEKKHQDKELNELIDEAIKVPQSSEIAL